MMNDEQINHEKMDHEQPAMPDHAPDRSDELAVEISNEQTAVEFDASTLRKAVERVLRDAGVSHGEVSIAVVDDATIHDLNARYLEHDWATDVLSFLLERDGSYLEGEIIVSAETAASSAERYGWRPQDELLLYVVHGTLHLLGYDDSTAEKLAEMRTMEQRCLEQFGLRPSYDDRPSL